MGISPSSLALITLENIITLCFRGVIPGDAMAHPDFGRSVNPISTRGYKLCPPNYYWHPGFSDHRRALCFHGRFCDFKSQNLILSPPEVSES